MLSDSDNVSPAVFTVFPMPEDTVAIDIDIQILLKLKTINGSIQNTEIVLSSPTGAVPGKWKKTDSSVIFIPDHELTPLTEYAVSAILYVNVNPDFSEQATNIVLQRKWKFFTEGKRVYRMEKRSDNATYFARDGNKLMQMGEYLYNYGGWYTTLVSNNDIYRSSGDLSVWEKVTNAPWAPRHTFGIGKIDSTLFVFGGDYYIDTFDVWKSEDGIQFTEVAHDLDSTVGSRLFYGACVHNKELFVVGGQIGVGIGLGIKDVWSSADGSYWKQTGYYLPFIAKNISGCVVSFNNRIWVIGGGYYEDPDLSQRWTNHIYSSEDGIIWRREPDAPWRGRQYADVCVWDNKLWMIGGHNGQNLADIWYMSKKGKWTEYEAPASFEARHASGIGVYNNKLVIVCGNYHNDCWVIEK